MKDTRPKPLKKMPANKLTTLVFTDEELRKLKALALRRALGFDSELEEIKEILGDISLKGGKHFGEIDLCIECPIKSRVQVHLGATCEVLQECKDFESTLNNITHPHYFSIRRLFINKINGAKP